MPDQSTKETHRPQRDRMAMHMLNAAKAAHGHIREEFGLPAKPAFRAMCNHCGLCCMASLCTAARAVNPNAEAPCEHLVLDDGKALCGLVIQERENGMVPIVRIGLGIGTGCSMGDPETTDAELDAFDNEVHRLNGPLMTQAIEDAKREHPERYRHQNS